MAVSTFTPTIFSTPSPSFKSPTTPHLFNFTTSRKHKSLSPIAALSDPFVLQVAESLEDSLPSSSSSSQHLQKLRDFASEALLSTSWPSRKDEPFRFTDTSFIKQSEIIPVSSPLKHKSLNNLSVFGDTLLFNLSIVDGYVVDYLSQLLGLPDGVYVGSLSGIKSSEVIKRVLEFLPVSEQGDLFWSLNGVGSPDLVVVYVPQGCRFEGPLHLRYVSSEGSDKDSRKLPVSNPRVLVVVEKDKARQLSKARQLDIITTLPQTIIETILCLLPIKEAARTSILSTEWRYKWTTIPKLKFFESSINISIEKLPIKKPSKMKQLDWWKLSKLEHERRDKELRCKFFSVIRQVLLSRQGPIHEFFLSMNAQDTYYEIDQIILQLSRNHTVKKLTLDFHDTSSYVLPLSFISSFRYLTDLSLEWCEIYDKPIFNGSDTLTRLSLARTFISGESLLHLLSNCPSLKSLCLILLGEQSYGDRPNIMELFKCLPVIEHLTTWGEIKHSFVLDSVPQQLPTSLSHLKYFCFQQMGLAERDGYTFGLPFLLVLLKCSPNLEKIELEIDERSFEPEDYSDIYEEYSDVWLEHLNEFKIEYFANSKSELELLYFILARSPSLKKVILPTHISDKNEEVELLQSLLRAPRASPVEIFVENRYKTRRNPC